MPFLRHKCAMLGIAGLIACSSVWAQEMATMPLESCEIEQDESRHKRDRDREQPAFRCGHSEIQYQECRLSKDDDDAAVCEAASLVQYEGEEAEVPVIPVTLTGDAPHRVCLEMSTASEEGEGTTDHGEVSSDEVYGDIYDGDDRDTATDGDKAADMSRQQEILDEIAALQSKIGALMDEMTALGSD